jgi:hypothetical protein
VSRSLFLESVVGTALTHQPANSGNNNAKSTPAWIYASLPNRRIFPTKRETRFQLSVPRVSCLRPDLGIE